MLSTYYYSLVGIRYVSVISTYADPIPAWSNSYGGMNGVTAGIGSGLLRNLFWRNIQLNIVCADFVTNGSLAIAWHTAREYHKSAPVPKIYHINRYPDPTLFFGTFTLALLHRCSMTRAFIRWLAFDFIVLFAVVRTRCTNDKSD